MKLTLFRFDAAMTEYSPSNSQQNEEDEDEDIVIEEEPFDVTYSMYFTTDEDRSEVEVHSSS
jgi:hypothetical protein